MFLKSMDMRKLLLLVGLSVFFLGNILAQGDTAVNKNKPVIKFDKMEYDFGTIKEGSNGTFEFSFVNEGKEPLVVSNVVKSCGCTSTDWIKEPVKKGKKGWIKVTYNTGIIGAFDKYITVYSNAAVPAVTLKFKGVVQPASTADNNQTK